MEKKFNKIGLLTFHSSNNYGALLQCYSLLRIFEEKGFDVKIINIKKEYIKDLSKLNFSSRLKKVLKNNLNNLLFEKNFDKFRSKYFSKHLTKPIKSVDALNELSNEFDAVFVGSDQVWRYDYTKELLPAFFLNFLSSSTLKFSYAASFGMDKLQDLPIEIFQSVKESINKFDLISVREDSGVKICNIVFKVNAEHVLDPVFLLSEKVISELMTKSSNISEKYICYYFLNPDKFRMDLLTNVSDKLKVNNTKSVYINDRFSFRRPSLNFEKFKFLSIPDWLATIHNAEFVVTDSFHGLAFSILLNKQFICIGNKKRGLSRMKSLLKILQLEHRLILPENSVNIEELDLIDYQKVNILLSEKRKESFNFIDKCCKLI